jgi:hypothetical protein
VRLRLFFRKILDEDHDFDAIAIRRQSVTHIFDSNAYHRCFRIHFAGARKLRLSRQILQQRLWYRLAKCDNLPAIYRGSGTDDLFDEGKQISIAIGADIKFFGALRSRSDFEGQLVINLFEVLANLGKERR